MNGFKYNLEVLIYFNDFVKQLIVTLGFKTMY